MNHILLLFNPQAGGGRARMLQPAMCREITERGIRLTVHSSTAPGGIREYLTSASLHGVDAVLAAGGDGTVFETLNGLMAHPAELRPPLGIVPVGTGNAFSRDLGLAAGDWRSALALVLEGQVRKVDVGQIDCATGQFHFLNIAGVGFVVAAGATAAGIKGLGRSAYTLAALWQTLRLPTQRLRLTVDGELIEQNNLFAEISNSRYTGTSFLIAPSARLDDGLLDLVLVRKLSRFRLLRLFNTIYSGSHVNHPEVTVIQGREFHLLEPAGSPMMVDGEFAGETPAVIRCLRDELAIFG